MMAATAAMLPNQRAFMTKEATPRTGARRKAKIKSVRLAGIDTLFARLNQNITVAINKASAAKARTVPNALLEAASFIDAFC